MNRARVYLDDLQTLRRRQLIRRRTFVWSARILGLAALAYLLLQQTGVQ